MPTNLVAAIENYLRSRNLSRGTRDEYGVTMRKWTEWGKDVPIEQMGRKDIREFLDWVHERAIAIDGSNPGRTSNKARENLRAVLAWAWEQDLIDALPRFPQPKQQRSVAGRHYLTKAELNALHFATYSYIVATNTSGLSLIVIFLCRRRERIDEQGSVFVEIEIVVERESLELF